MSETTGRYETSLAPDTLAFTQALMNTIGHVRPPEGDDLLSDTAAAERWLLDACREWAGARAEEAPELAMNELQLGILHRTREQIRQAAEQPSGARAELAPVRVSLDKGRVEIAPLGSGMEWVKSALSVEAIHAEARGERNRLKLCRNNSCGVAFYDRSKNNSRVWHDVRTCGNTANSQRFRDRRSSGPEEA